MINSIVSALGQATSAAFTWFGDMVSSTGTLSLIVTAIIICLVFRFLIRPLVGQAMSDGVRAIRGRDLTELKRESYQSSIVANNARADYYNKR